MPMDVRAVLCAQLTRDLLAIAKFLFITTMALKVTQGHRQCPCPAKETSTRSAAKAKLWQFGQLTVSNQSVSNTASRCNVGGKLTASISCRRTAVCTASIVANELITRWGGLTGWAEPRIVLWQTDR